MLCGVDLRSKALHPGRRGVDPRSKALHADRHHFTPTVSTSLQSKALHPDRHHFTPWTKALHALTVSTSLPGRKHFTPQTLKPSNPQTVLNALQGPHHPFKLPTQHPPLATRLKSPLKPSESHPRPRERPPHQPPTLRPFLELELKQNRKQNQKILINHILTIFFLYFYI